MNKHDYQEDDRGWCGDRSRGAALGRVSTLEEDAKGPLTIRCVPLDDGGYDPGGTYWGIKAPPQKLFLVSDGELVSYLTANSFKEAKAEFPHATWAPSVFGSADLVDMVQGYSEAALFYSTDHDDEDDTPLSNNYNTSDFAPDTLAEMESDCREFVEANEVIIGELGKTVDIDWSLLGHSLWLSINGHAGFGSGDWPDPYDDQFSNAVTASEGFFYVGDDGMIHSD